MIADEERRNVAANIRSAAERRKYDLLDDPDYSPFAALYVVFCGVRGFLTTKTYCISPTS